MNLENFFRIILHHQIQLVLNGFFFLLLQMKILVITQGYEDGGMLERETSKSF